MHRFFQDETIFVLFFLIVTNTFKIYFWDISDTSRNKHLFQICLRRLKDFSKKDIIFEMYLRRLKDFSKKTSFLRCIWDVLTKSQKDVSFEMFLRGLWDVSLSGDLFETSQRHLMPAGWLFLYLITDLFLFITYLFS